MFRKRTAGAILLFLAYAIWQGYFIVKEDPILSTLSWRACFWEVIFTLVFLFGFAYFFFEGLCLLVWGKRLVWPALTAWLEYKEKRKR